jgi:hypothetical protein
VTWPPNGRDSRDIRDIRDSCEVDALVTDRYLETLLAAHARGADSGPASAEADPAIRETMARLARDLPRFHPSFRFEEALGNRLAEAAARVRMPGAQAPGRASSGTLTIVPDPAAGTAPSTDLRPAVGRPLLIGGALTSAALSLAGAVYLAWRFRRPSASPMARAVRAVARTRLA